MTMCVNVADSSLASNHRHDIVLLVILPPFQNLFFTKRVSLVDPLIKEKHDIGDNVKPSFLVKQTFVCYSVFSTHSS